MRNRTCLEPLPLLQCGKIPFPVPHITPPFALRLPDWFSLCFPLSVLSPSGTMSPLKCFETNSKHPRASQSKPWAVALPAGFPGRQELFFVDVFARYSGSLEMTGTTILVFPPKTLPLAILLGELFQANLVLGFLGLFFFMVSES